MSPRLCVLLAGLGSLGLLLGALAFQFLGGLAPCPMCIWQRWPHLAAVVLAALALTVLRPLLRPLAGLGALCTAVAAALGVFHAGVERGWWEGPTSCVGFSPAGLSPDQLLDRLTGAPLVRCDEIVWQFLGLSMAGWNAALSFLLTILWLRAALARDNQRTS